MNTPPSTDIRVCVDVGSRKHSVAVGLADGRFLDAFEVDRRPEGFDRFFQRIDDIQRQHGGKVSVAMEGYNGWARPLDSLVQRHHYRLFKSTASGSGLDMQHFRQRQARLLAEYRIPRGKR